MDNIIVDCFFYSQCSNLTATNKWTEL